MKIGKLLSWLSLGIVVIALLGIGGFNLYKKYHRPELKIKMIPFGLPPGTRIFTGREPDLEKSVPAPDPFASQLIIKAEKYRIEGKLNQAIAHLEEALRVDSKAISAYMLLIEYLNDSTVNDQLKNLQRTHQLFEEAIKVSKGHPAVHNSFGDFLWYSDEYEAAQQQYEISCDLSPAFVSPIIGLGKCYLRKERYEDAREKFQTAISLLGEINSAPLDFLALTYYQMGHDDSAALIVEYASEKGIEKERLKFVEGLLLESAGQMEAAASIYDMLLKTYNKVIYKQALSSLGRKPLRGNLAEAVNRKDRKWKEATQAIEVLDPMVRKYNKNAPLWSALGQAYYQRGLYAHAVECFDSALSIDPSEMFSLEYRSKAFNRVPSEKKDVVKNSGNKIIIANPDSSGAAYQMMEIMSGHYQVRWGAFPSEVREKYPHIPFIELSNHDLKYDITSGSEKYETLLHFKQDRLWGVRVFVTDTTKGSDDVLGKMIGINSKISGHGRATGSAYCTGYKAFQAVIWENDDTFEMMAQFKEKNWQIRLARVSNKSVPNSRKLCDLLFLLDKNTWK